MLLFNVEYTNVPPHEPVYQYHDEYEPRLPPFSSSVVDCPEQRFTGLADIETAGWDTELTVTFTVTQVVVLQEPSALTQ